MAEIKQLFQISSLPGIKRDGTTVDADNFNDGQWVRFQRGRPKKMGGYQRISDKLSGPSRASLVWSRESMNAIYSFSPYGIEMLLVDNNGLGSSIVDRTPAGFTTNTNAMWSTATQYDAAVGSSATVVLAHCSSSLTNIDSTATSKPYLGIANGNGVFTQIVDAPAVSGGVFSTAPYTVAYSSDGLVSWSDANQPQIWSTSSGNIGDAGATRATGAKIVKGLPLRSGSGPAALLWSLDSVVRMDYIGGQAIFRFSHLTSQSSVLAQNSVIEYDGAYFWLGVDRFLACDGGKVSELPNQMNINYFFDNLNYEQRQKVWAMKIPRYGEIWWFFPFGDSLECNKAVIFNVREQSWYDAELQRSGGFYSQVFRYPVMTSSNASETTSVVTLSGGSGTVSIGDVVNFLSSGVSAIVSDKVGSNYYLSISSGKASQILVGEGLSDVTSGATGTVATAKLQYSVYLHEKGWDAVEGDNTSAIPSFFETADFGLPTGGVPGGNGPGINRWTRLVRVEPDFVMEGNMQMQVTGREFAQAPESVSELYNFTPDTTFIDLRQQKREIRLKFYSNEVGGHYEMGKVILHTEPGDVRS